jgi:hypothetical protein
MDEDPPREKVLIERRINFFQEIEAAGLQSQPGLTGAKASRFTK